MPLATRLSPVDLGIVALYLVAITLFGLRFAKSSKQDKSLKSYFLADNAIPWWAIALSIVSAETSTLTIISIPGVAFAGNLGFLQIVLGYMLGRIVVAFLFLPRYFRGEMLTAYQLIDRRFGHTLHKITAGLFLLTRAAAEGVRVFAISIVVSIAIGTGDTASIAIISALTLLYTFEGGMRAVIWTDVAQMILYLAGTFAAILTLGYNTPGGWSHIHAVAAPLGKFQVLNFSLNLTTSYTFWAGILGGTFLTMASHGTDQLMVQRMLAARNLRASRLALLSSGAVIFLQFTLFLLIGVGLFVFYSTHPAVFKTNDYIFPTYIVREMPHGISGLLIAAILAAAMSNLSAALNSLASTTVIDFYLPFMGRHKPNAVILSEAKDPRSSPGSTENSTLISRAATIVWALILFLIAVYSIHAGGKGHVVETGLSIASVAYGCLLGVFLLGTLIPPSSRYSPTQTGAILGMISGFLTNLFLYQATFPHPLIPLSLHIAFTWYVLIGAVATFLIGSLFSLTLPKPRRATIRRAVTFLLLLFFVLSFPKGICFSSAEAQPQPRRTTNNEQRTHTPPYDFTPVSTLITTAIADKKLPGAVVLIGHNGQVIFQQAYGVRKLANEPGLDGKPSAAEPMTLDTIFDMASLTKVIVTTTAILQLYEQGKLSLDAPVAKYLPEFANPATTPGGPSFASSAKGGLSSEARPPSAVPSPKPVIQNEPSSSSPPLKPVILSGAIAPSAIAQSKDPDTVAPTSTARPFSTTNPPSPAANWKSQITIRQLLTHYSGLPEDVSLKDDWGLKSPDKAEGIRRAMASIPYGPPGVTFKYSDINFITLGYLVEKLSGQDLDVYARNQIFNPLGMNDTSYLPIAEACGDGLSVPPYSWGTQRGPRKSNAIWECLVPPQAKQPWNASNLVFRIAPTAHDDESKTNPTANPYFDTLLRGTVHDPTTRRMGGVAGHAGLFSTAADMSLFCQALLDKLTKNTGPFPLKQSTLQLATSPQAPATAATNATIFTPNGQTTTGIAQRGLGWDLNTAFSRPRGEIFPITTKAHAGSFGHTGFTGTSLWLDPTSDTYVILLANAIHPRGNATISPLRGQVATAAARALGLGPATFDQGVPHDHGAAGGVIVGLFPTSPQPPGAPGLASDTSVSAHPPTPARNAVILSAAKDLRISPEPAQPPAPHLRDGLIVTKVGIGEADPSTSLRPTKNAGAIRTIAFEGQRPETYQPGPKAQVGITLNPRAESPTHSVTLAPTQPQPPVILSEAIASSAIAQSKDPEVFRPAHAAGTFLSTNSQVTSPPQQPKPPLTDEQKKAAQKALKSQLQGTYDCGWAQTGCTLTGIDVLEQTHFAALKSLTTHKPLRPGGPSFGHFAKGGLSSEARPSSSEPPQPPSAPFIAHSAMSGITGPPPITPRTDAERSAAQKALKLALHNHPYKTWIDEEPTLTGIDVLEQTHFAELKSMAKGLKGSGHGLRIALLTNQSGLDSQGNRTIDILLHADPQIKLVKLFTPEHGLLVKQDTENLKAETDPTTNLPVISLYGAKSADRHPKPEDLKDLDAVVIDLQDMGVRFWTYETVLGYFLEGTFCNGPQLIVLDRPNPIGGLAVQGNLSETINYNSYMPLPVRHGLTYGELAKYFRARYAVETVCIVHTGLLPAKGSNRPLPPLPDALTVVPMQNWHRADFFADTHLPFTPPSPNMKTLAATILYPGIGLIDQTNISVGRGTDTPYENIGLPWVTSPNAQELADYLTARHIPGITFTPTTLTIAETPEKYPGHGQTIPGIHFTITDRIALDTPELGIELLSALHHLYPTQFQLDRVATLLANPETLAALKSGTDPRTIAATWLPALQEFRTATAPYLLYH